MQKKKNFKTTKQWKDSKISMIKNHKKYLVVDMLFDIEANMDVLTGDEAAFYADQLSDQNCRINMDVDLKYVNKKQMEFEKEVCFRTPDD